MFGVHRGTSCLLCVEGSTYIKKAVKCLLCKSTGTERERARPETEDFSPDGTLIGNQQPLVLSPCIWRCRFRALVGTGRPSSSPSVAFPSRKDSRLARDSRTLLVIRVRVLIIREEYEMLSHLYLFHRLQRKPCILTR